MGNAAENDQPEVGREAGGKYLDGKLRMLGLSNAEVNRLTDVDSSMISRARRGKATPDSATISKIVNGLRPLAEQRGVILDGMELRIKFGLVDPADLDSTPIDPLYRKLHEIGLQLAATDPDAAAAYRRQLELILAGARAALPS